MEGCREKITLFQERMSINFYGSKTKKSEIILECSDSKGHKGQHVATVWTNLFNPATGEKGILKYFYW